MKKEYSGVPARVLPVIEKAVGDAGCVIWDIEFSRRGADRVLEITIDSDEGIGIELCEQVHRIIDVLLDEADPIEDAYILEVSSPGVERSLTLPWHFDACIGEEAEVRLFAPLTPGASKTLRCTLGGYDEEKQTVLINDGTEEKVLPFDSISACRLIYDFSLDQ